MVKPAFSADVMELYAVELLYLGADRPVQDDFLAFHHTNATRNKHEKGTPYSERSCATSTAKWSKYGKQI